MHQALRKKNITGLQRLLATLLPLMAQLPAMALADIEETTVYYSVYGGTEFELMREIGVKGPNGFAGYTDSELSYRYTTFKGGSNCRVAALTIDLLITYTLPRWENQSEASTDLQRAWSVTNAALLRHEQQHGAYAKEAYRKIQGQIGQIGFRDSCEEVRSEVDAIVAAVSAERTEKNRSYDARTDHGRTEGAVFFAAQNDSGSSEQNPGGSNAFWYFIGALSLGLLYFARR